MLKNMTGKFGFQNGLRFSKPKICACGATFYGPSKECDECYFKQNYLKVGKCIIENAPGRCEETDLTCEHYNECLDAANKNNWIGWRKVKNGNQT